LFEKKIGDAGDDAGFVAPDDGDGGELFHGRHELHELAGIETQFYRQIREIRGKTAPAGRAANPASFRNFSRFWLLKRR
jgi:hypothetical protein